MYNFRLVHVLDTWVQLLCTYNVLKHSVCVCVCVCTNSDLL